MRMDEEGRLVCTPAELHHMAMENPQRLLRGFLMGGTPRVFPSYQSYCDFLDAVSDRTGVHTKNKYVRGSCHIGFSISPRVDKVWASVHEKSDIDLVIVDSVYFARAEEELRHWEARNPVSPTGKGAAAVERRAQDRQFNCLRDKGLPKVVCVHHQKMMASIAEMSHCGGRREVSAFVYPDWCSAQQRYEFDLQDLCEKIARQTLPPPPPEPLPSV